MTTPPDTSDQTSKELDKTLLGQLIAEIAKFGGFDKHKSSQLATILLPYIDQHTEKREKAARIDELARAVTRNWIKRDKLVEVEGRSARLKSELEDNL